MNHRKINQLETSKSHPLIQFIKYAISGGFASITHITVFHLAAWKLFPSLQAEDLAVIVFGLPIADVEVGTRSINSMLSNGLAFVFSNLVAYIINIRWVFTGGRHNRIIEIGLFYLVSGISIVVGTSMMGFLIRYFGILTTYAFSANMVSAALINYVSRKYLIFKG